jgi:hypothetical protein
MTSSNHPQTSQIIPYTHDWTIFILHNDNNNNMQSGGASSQVQMKTTIGEWRERLFHAKIPRIYHDQLLIPVPKNSWNSKFFSLLRMGFNDTCACCKYLHKRLNSRCAAEPKSAV